MTKRKAPHLKLKPGPKPGSKRTVRAQPAQPAAEQIPPQSSDPLQRGRDIRSMGEAELRRYALQVGVLARDAESLPVDLLRQNCTLVLMQLVDDL